MDRHILFLFLLYSPIAMHVYVHVVWLNNLYLKTCNRLLQLDCCMPDIWTGNALRDLFLLR